MQEEACQEELHRCVAYFAEREVYRKLFGKVREKYASLGHFGGTVQMTGLNEEECRQLGGFFQKDYSGKKTVGISYAAMEKALENSRFSGLRWEDILREYFGEALVVKKEQALAEKEKREQFFARILEEMPENPGSVWLQRTLNLRGEGYLLLLKQYKESPEQLREVLRQFLKAVPKIPALHTESVSAEKELLAVFAAETTGDPHFFDAGTLGEQLMTAFLKENIPNSIGKTIFRAEEKAGLFYEAGLLKDDLSNHTLVYGVHAWTKGGSLHEGIEGFLSRREPLLLTLMTLGGLAEVGTQGKKCVYIVENPAVFSTLVKAWPEAAVICGNGQIRLATLVLLDLFEPETRFYYAGDFDPEGLQIAQKLRERYGERLALWNYRKEYYLKYRSEVEISAKSLKKLNKVCLVELQEIKMLLQEEKRAAYQEAMLREYLAKKPDEKLEGAVKFGNAWAIPETAEKPQDNRGTSGSYRNWRKNTSITEKPN